ncbi:FAD-dependent monooxygenase [Cephaloticoccus primus]|uniref:FAD-dependent monooxygenase n=1 Tax=Cephaloticoccus primus TaxID=1548207 RepID=UPI000ADC0E7F|nr:FAD-dependent monooxygenase [Cephaloticoccus primus]
MNNNQKITSNSKIVIAGAGIGGLTTALSLHKAGFTNIEIIESARELKPLGLGINILPEAVGVLYRLGLMQQLRKTGIATAEFHYMDQTGNLIWSQRCGLGAGKAYPQYSIHRGELQMLLFSVVNQRLGSQAIKLGTCLEHIEQTAKQVTLHCRNREDDDTFQASADLLIGADGIHSTVCSTLHPHAPSINWSPFTIWRGITLMDTFLDGQTMILTHDPKWTRLATYAISKRHADSGKALVNWLCLVPHATLRANNISDGNTSGSLGDVLPYVAHWNLDWLDVTNLLSNSQLILQYPMVDRDPLPFWSKGRVTLLGDAAHPMYPTASNGASQAIVDAAVLSSSLARTNDLSTALAEYEHKRRDASYGIVLANRKREREEWAAATMATHAKRAEMNRIISNYNQETEIARKVS